MTFRSALPVLALLAGTAASASAQPSIQAVVGASVDRLDRGAATTESSAAPAGSLSVEHLALDGRLRLAYDLDAGTFSSDGDWHYLQHNAGVRYRVGLGAKTGLFVGGSAALRANGDSWSSANYRAGGLFANVEHTFGRGTLRTGVRADRRVFADQPELDQWETNTFASLRLSFQTRTTVIGEVSVGWKRFDEGAMWLDTSSAADHVPVAGAGATPVGTPGGQGPGGNGSGGPMGNAGGAGGALPSAGTWMRPSVLTSSRLVTTGGDRARQVTLFGRVAQSLADRLALTVDVTRRDAAGAVAPALVTTPEMLIDDGVYDDPFASDATVARVGLKRVFDGGRVLDGGVSFWSKTYEATPAFDERGASVAGLWRDDEVWRVETSWREPIAPGRTGHVDLALIALYTFMDSASTDAFYTYRSHRVRAMLSVGF